MSELTSAPLKRLLIGLKPRSYPKGQILVYAGDKPEQVYLLKKGVLKLYAVDDANNEKIVHLVRPLAVFPAVLFFGDVASSSEYFYSTLTSCEVYAIPRDIFIKQLASDSELSMYCVRWFASEMHDIMARVTNLERTETYDKLAAALKLLAKLYSGKSKFGWRRVSFPVSHQLLADLTGVTRESITIAMQQLQADKLVRSPKQLILEINHKLFDR